MFFTSKILDKLQDFKYNINKFKSKIDNSLPFLRLNMHVSPIFLNQKLLGKAYTDIYVY